MRFTTPQWRPSAAKRRTPLRSAIDVSAFASIMFALLFLFLGLYQPVHTFHPPADLAKGEHSSIKPDALREDALIVTVSRDGTLYFRNTKMWPADLPDAIREALRGGAKDTVYINADARAKYSDVKAVLDQIHQSGLQNITFLTEYPHAVSTP
jgi:biopolymer transport protein ExbD